ncbi:MAG: CRISPR-associated ring nuclease Csm6 [Syntrophobacteraceae bacterium]|nr:CRISPR-associated ring nuclease Csm6 [Syntrophobacteraceae bacterium]
MRSKPCDLRNVLVAVSGQTPAIITETLWALERRFATSVDEIRVITTTQGLHIIEKRLLGANGEFSRFCADYGISPGRIAFSEKNVYVLEGSDGRGLEDIRTGSDNLNAADQVFGLISEWCGRKGERLLCSVAGGRKTLGIYLAMSLMMCGRARDKLYHVLVTPEFETGVPDFFYPPPVERFFDRFCRGEGQAPEKISSAAAGVELAEIPFLRLREAIGEGIDFQKGYTEAVAQSQLLMNYLHAPPSLTLKLKTRQVGIGQFEFTLSRQLAAVYGFFLLQFNGLGAHGSMDSLFEKRELLSDLERQIDRYGVGEKAFYSWERMRDADEFREQIGPCISKVNRALRRGLGSGFLASRYAISTGRRYGVNVELFKVFGADGKTWKGLR